MRVTLGGLLIPGMSDVSWTLADGVAATRERWIVDNVTARRLMQMGGKPLTLVADGEILQVGVYVTGTESADAPHQMVVILQDARWRWPRIHVASDFNLRRRTGESRLLGEGEIQTRTILADEAYAAWSLRNGKPWTAAQALANVVRRLGGGILDTSALTREIAIEDVLLDAQGDVALGQLLQLLPGYTIAPTRKGIFRVKDNLGRGEVAIVERGGPPAVGFPGESNRTFIRPGKIHILFEREVELRFDFDETDTTDYHTVSRAERDIEPRVLENVLPCPDPILTLSGGRKVTQGTWITFKEFYDACANTDANGALPRTAQPWGNLSNEVMRRMALRTWEQSAYITDERGQEDAVWERRLRVAYRHFRKTYRIVPAWRDRIRGLRAYRLGLLDYETGGHGPAQAFMDYTVIPSLRAISVKSIKGGDTVQMQHDFDGYNVDLAAARPAPMEVTVIDPEAGIVRVYPIVGPYGLEDAIVPGKLDTRGSLAISSWTKPEEIFGLFKWGHPLASDFQAAVVLTAIQACPNNTGRYHIETRQPHQISGLVGTGIGRSLGPAWAVKVQASPTTTARFAWKDTYAEEINQMFWSGVVDDDDPQDDKKLKDVLINKDAISQIADAVAAGIYAALADRVEGRWAVPLLAGLEPDGTVRSVEHRVDVDGRGRTYLSAESEGIPRDMWRYMPMAVQRTLRGLIAGVGA